MGWPLSVLIVSALLDGLVLELSARDANYSSLRRWSRPGFLGSIQERRWIACTVGSILLILFHLAVCSFASSQERI